MLEASPLLTLTDPYRVRAQLTLTPPLGGVRVRVQVGPRDPTLTGGEPASHLAPPILLFPWPLPPGTDQPSMAPWRAWRSMADRRARPRSSRRSWSILARLRGPARWERPRCARPTSHRGAPSSRTNPAPPRWPGSPSAASWCQGRTWRPDPEPSASGGGRGGAEAASPDPATWSVSPAARAISTRAERRDRAASPRLPEAMHATPGEARGSLETSPRERSPLAVDLSPRSAGATRGPQPEAR